MTDTKMSPNKFVTQGKTRLVNSTIISPEMGNLRLIFTPCGKQGKPDTALHAVLNKKWRTVAAELKGWHAQNFTFKMGNVHSTAVQSDTWVLHALCYNEKGVLDEKALESCVKAAAALAKSDGGSLHVSTLSVEQMPQLADYLSKYVIDRGLACYFYQEPGLDKTS
jgi:hypothetical protein